MGPGSELGPRNPDPGPRCLRHRSGLPRAGPEELSGDRTNSARSGRLGEASPGPLGAGHEPEGDIGSGRGGQHSTDLSSQALGPDAQPSRKGKTTHAAADVGTNVAEAWGRCWVGGSAWPPHPTLVLPF